MKMLFASICLIVVILPVTVVSIPAADHRSAADEFMVRLTDENFPGAVAMFTPWLAERHPATELERVWYKTVAQYGPYQNYTFGKIASEDPFISYLYTLKFGSATLAAVIAFNNSGEIMTFVLQPPEGDPVTEEPFWIVPGGEAAINIPEDNLPSYVDTSKFVEVEFTMQGGTPIAATMALAQINEPNPVVLLFKGFGPANRDEKVGAVEPLKDIAWGLASRGIASIRFDSRSSILPPHEIATLDLDAYILDDLAAMLAYIRMSSSIFDTTKIFLAGHGMGAMVAPLAAARDGGLAGVILLSAPARPLHEQLLDIIDKDSKTAGGKASAVDFREQGARSFLDSLKYRNLPRQQMLFVAPVGVWYDIMDADPVATAKSLTIPLLLVQSGRDAKTSETDFQIWKKALKGKNNVTAKQFPDLNHYYQPGHGPATADEFRTNPAPVDSRIIDLLETWIKSR